MLKLSQARYAPYTPLRIEIPDASPSTPVVPIMQQFYNSSFYPPPHHQSFGIANLQKFNFHYRPPTFQAPKTSTMSVPQAGRRQGTTKLKDFYIESILELNKSETAPVAPDYKPSWNNYSVNAMHYCGYSTVPKMDNVETMAVSSTKKGFGENSDTARRDDSDVDCMFASSPSSTSSNLEEFNSTFNFEDSTSTQTNSKPKRARTTFTLDQMQILESRFNDQQYMVGEERIRLAKSLNLKESQVKIWFQNRRIKWRKQNLEKMSKKPRNGMKKMKRFYYDFNDTRSV